MSLLSIYDLNGHYMAYAAPVPRITTAFVVFGKIHLLAATGKLYVMHEHTLQNKLDVLFR